MNGSEQPKKYWLLPGFLFSLVLSAVFLYCFPQPNLIYVNEYGRVGWSFTAVASALGVSRQSGAAR